MRWRWLAPLRFMWLVWDEIRAHILRTALLTIGVAVSVTIFLFALAIGQSNARELHDTVSGTQGIAGTYLAQFTATTGASWDQSFLPEVRRLIRESAPTAYVVLQRFHLDDTFCRSPSVQDIDVVDGDVSRLLSRGFRPGALYRNADDSNPQLSDCRLSRLPVRVNSPRPATTPVAVSPGQVMVGRARHDSIGAAPSSATSVLIEFGTHRPQAVSRFDTQLRILMANYAAFEDSPAAGYIFDRVDTASQFANSESSAQDVMYAFAGASMFLSCMALTLSYLSATDQRRGTVGLARAAGALRSQLLTSVITEVIAVVIAGGAVGVALAQGLSGALPSLPGDVREHDVLSVPAVSVMFISLLLTAVVAATAPCIRVSRIGVADVLTGAS